MSLEGTHLGYYQLLHQIGSGGMGTVYLAQDTHLPRQVAIKIVRTDGELYQSTETAEKIERLFQREVQTIARLNHPHILSVIDTGQAEVNHASYTYLVMPYCPAGSLMEWLRKKRQQSPYLDLHDISTFLSQAAEALQHAHEHNIVHQDVKPSNFLLRARTIAGQTDPLPDLLLADFGLARLLAASASTTTQGIRGTPSYMPPEQWDGKPVPASDQYALAVMAFQLLTAQFPFQGGPGQVMYMHYTQPAPAPSSLNTQLTSAIDAVILRALSKQAAERFPSITAFAQAFFQALDASDNTRSLVLKANVEAPSSSDATLSLATHAISTDEVAGIPQEQASPTPHAAPDRSELSTDQPVTHTKPFHLSQRILIGVMALLILATSGALLYRNSITPTNHPPAPVHSSSPSQGPRNKATGSIVGPTTAPTSQPTHGSGTTPSGATPIGNPPAATPPHPRPTFSPAPKPPTPTVPPQPTVTPTPTEPPRPTVTPPTEPPTPTEPPPTPTPTGRPALPANIPVTPQVADNSTWWAKNSMNDAFFDIAILAIIIVIVVHSISRR